jgi:hypothetical protein
MRPDAWIGFLHIAEHLENFRHRGKPARLDLRRAARNHNVGSWSLALDPANGLPRLPRGFRRHRAGVDDDEIAPPARRSSPAHRLRLDKIEPAAKGYNLDIRRLLAKGRHNSRPKN